MFCQHWIKIQKCVVYELRSAHAILRSWASIDIWHIRWFAVKMPTSASLAVSASLVSSTWDVLNVLNVLKDEEIFSLHHLSTSHESGILIVSINFTRYLPGIFSSPSHPRQRLPQVLATQSLPQGSIHPANTSPRSSLQMLVHIGIHRNSDSGW